MGKRLGLATLAFAVLAACSGDPLAITTQGPITTTTPTASTAPIVTRPIPSIAPGTIAPETTPPVTEPPASPPTTAPQPPNATTPAASPGELEVLTATGVGNPLTNPDVLHAIDDLGLTTDSSGDYTFYGGETDHPFVNIENGRLESIWITRDAISATFYRYAFDLPEGQSPKTTAELAAAPLRAKYPSASISTDTSDDDGIQEFSLSVFPGDESSWRVTATTNPEFPNVGLVEYGYVRDYAEQDPVGPDLVVARFLPTVEATLSQASLPTTNITRTVVDVDTGLFSISESADVLLYVQVDILGQDFATAAQTVSTLADHGWTLNRESEDSLRYSLNSSSIIVSASDDPDELRTSVSLYQSLGDDPTARPGGS